MNKAQPKERYCVYCGKPIPADAGNRALYCSDAHKQAAYRERLDRLGAAAGRPGMATKKTDC